MESQNIYQNFEIDKSELKKIVKFRNSICMINLFISLLLYLVVLLGLERQWELMFLYGIWSIGVYLALIVSELRHRGMGLFLLFFIGAIMRQAYPIVDSALRAMNGAKFSYFYDYTDYIFSAAIAIQIYYMLFVIGLTHFSKDKMMSIVITPLLNIRHFNTIVSVIYLIGVVYSICPEWFSFLGFLTMIFTQLNDICLVALAFYCAYSGRKSSRILFYIFIIINELIAVFIGFYKGAIIMPVIIYVVYYIMYNRLRDKRLFSIKAIGLALFLAAFIFVFAYPFMTAKRALSGWNPTEGVTVDFSTMEILHEMLTNSADDESDVGGAFSSRLNSLDCNAYFYMFANEHGFHQDVLVSCFRMFYPKWLGRDTEYDVQLNPGYMLDSYMVYGHVVKNPTLSSANAGRFGAAYLWGGWPAALVMCLFNACLIAYLFEISKKRLMNVFGALIFLSIFMGAIYCFEESAHSGGFKTAIVWMIQLVLLQMTKSLKIIRV